MARGSLPGSSSKIMPMVGMTPVDSTNGGTVSSTEGLAGFIPEKMIECGDLFPMEIQGVLATEVRAGFRRNGLAMHVPRPWPYCVP